MFWSRYWPTCVITRRQYQDSIQKFALHATLVFELSSTYFFNVSSFFFPGSFPSEVFHTGWSFSLFYSSSSGRISNFLSCFSSRLVKKKKKKEKQIRPTVWNDLISHCSFSYLTLQALYFPFLHSTPLSQTCMLSLLFPECCKGRLLPASARQYSACV